MAAVKLFRRPDTPFDWRIKPFDSRAKFRGECMQGNLCLTLRKFFGFCVGFRFCSRLIKLINPSFSATATWQQHEIHESWATAFWNVCSAGALFKFDTAWRFDFMTAKRNHWSRARVRPPSVTDMTVMRDACFHDNQREGIAGSRFGGFIFIFTKIAKAVSR
jgi:hypothetical protein